MSTLEERLGQLEKDVQLIKECLKKREKERALTLKEKFIIHDHSHTLESQFCEVLAKVPDSFYFQWKIQGEEIGAQKNVKQELNRIFNDMLSLIDRALGVKP